MPDDPLQQFVGAAVDEGRPVDPGTIEISAVTTGPEVRRLRRKGLGFAGWLSLGWITLVVRAGRARPGAAARRPQGEHHRHRPARTLRRRRQRARSPARRRLQRARHAVAAHLGRTHHARDRGVAVLIGCVFGGVLGILGGYFRGWVDTIVSLVLDVLLAIPAVILALALVTVLRTQPGSSGGIDPEVALILAIGAVSIPVLGRITRASTLSWSEREFVTAARGPGREPPAHHLPRGAAQRGARHVLHRAARRRGGHRRRGQPHHPRRERGDRHTHVGQHDRHRPHPAAARTRTSCSNPRW